MSSKEELKILAFESSCDDSSVASLVVSPGRTLPQLKHLAVQSQDEVHQNFGGVVPELASRAHLKNLLPVLRKVLSESQWRLEEVDIFAATSEPGLIGSLLVGHTAAKTLSLLYNRPLISCHHLEGHLVSIFLEEDHPDFPFLALLVSGGHTSLYCVRSYDEFELIGETLDDAVGEAFDKAAQLFELGFPGGAKLEKFAEGGDPSAYSFPDVRVEGIQFSFSGLKSQLVRFHKTIGNQEEARNLAASYQEALIRHLEAKLKRALEQSSLRELVVVGGVARNQKLRSRLQQFQIDGRLTDIYFPRLELCTDNAAMIGFRAYHKFMKSEFSSLDEDVRSTARPKRKPKKS